MGLSQRKEKQRIGYDPRNLSWSGNKDRFSYKHMKALGWTDTSGIGGADLRGNAKHIAVVHKLDSAGIGMARAMKEGDEMGGQARAGLEDVLKRLALASASASPGGSPAPDIKPGEEQAKLRNRIASRQRHLQAKRLASSSPIALAEILGIAPSALPSPDTTIIKIEPGTIPPVEVVKPVIKSSTPIRDSEDMVTTSAMSVSDYFRQKMRARALARHAADETMPQPEPEVPIALGSKVAMKWEGTKMAFSEAEEAVPLSFAETADEPIIGSVTAVEPESRGAQKAVKKARKAAKEAKRAWKAQRKAKTEGKVVDGEEEDKEARRKKRKREAE